MSGTPHVRPLDGAGLPTSPIQDGLWFLSHVDGSHTATTTLAYRITGQLDLAALRSAWRFLLHRHDALRTSLPDRDGVVRQRISADPLTDLTVVDAAEAPDPERLVRDVANAAARLDTGPLAHLTAVRLSAAEHVVVLVLHQAVADDASTSILTTELSACYAAIAEGRRPDLGTLPAPQYVRFAREQRDRITSQELLRACAWWVETLTPPPQPLDLPTDRPRPAYPSGQGAALRFEWTDIGQSIRERADAARTTPETVLLAAFQVFLHRIGGADRFAVGVPVDTRRTCDAGLVGAFENLVALSADFRDELTFDDHVRRTAATERDAVANADVPFDRVVHALNVDREPHRMPLVDALFVRARQPHLRVPGTAVRALPVSPVGVRADLALTVHPVGNTIAGSLAYRASLFDSDSVHRLLDQLHTLLAAALERPWSPVGDLPLEDAAEVRAATRAADRTHHADTDGRTVTERIRAFAAHRPDAPAMIWEGTVVSYGELVRRANAITRTLRDDRCSHTPGTANSGAIAVRLPPGPLQVAAIIGVLDAGAHVVCLGTGDAGERGRAVLADLRPAYLLVHGDADEDELAVWFRDELGGRALDVTSTATGAEWTEPAPGRADERAYVAYTSGSTGHPKGIPTSHASLAQFVGWFATEFRVGAGSRVAQWAAPGYDASLVEIFAALTAGATLCPVPDRIRANPEKMVGWLAAERVTLLQTVPSFAREILRAATASDTTEPLTTLDHLLLAGEAFPGDLANALRAAFPSARLINLYGPTETILATWHEIASETAGPVPIGQPIPGRQVLVLDDHDQPCPTGVTGNLVVMSPHVAPGYTGAATGERAAFEPPDDPAPRGIASVRCYRTGDLGRRRWDGALEFRGRGDLQVKLQGNRVELTEIEATLAGHESVAECAVTPVTNAEGLVTRLVANVVPARDGAGRALGSAKDWRAVLRTRFGRSPLPVSFNTMLGLPRNLGGKVDRRLLPTPTAPTTTRSGMDKAIAEVWADVLGEEPASADETFFAAGGHSLLMPVLLSRLRGRVGIEIPLRDFLTDPTIAGLSARSGSSDAGHATSETKIG